MLDKYVKVLAAIILTAIIGNVGYRWYIANIKCAGSRDSHENVCSITMAINQIATREGRKIENSPEEINACWCARNI